MKKIVIGLVLLALIGCNDSNTTPTPTPTPTLIISPIPTSVTYYKNCEEAKKAKTTPLYKGDPGYRLGLDDDGDGVACE